MSFKSFHVAVCSLVGAIVLCGTGCFSGFTTQGPGGGILTIPIPVTPYLQDKQEDKHWERERYSRVPILGPLLVLEWDDGWWFLDFRSRRHFRQR